jgi:hypothetical protein
MRGRSSASTRTPGGAAIGSTSRATMTVVEMRAFFVAVMGLLERYVPPERLDAEVSNLIAVTDEIAGGMQDRLGAG